MTLPGIITADLSEKAVLNTDIPAFDRYLNTRWDSDKGFMSIPRTAPLPHEPRNMLIMDIFEVHNSPTKKQGLAAFKSHTVDLIERFAFGDLLEKGDPRIVEARAKIRSMAKVMDRIDTNNISLQEAGGGIAYPYQEIALMDRRASSLKQRVDGLFNFGDSAKIGEREEFYSAKFTRHHESAHMILSLHEPGADYVATVLTLRDHPEARTALQMEADLRLIEGMAGGSDNYDAYGMECQRAIESAMKLSPSEIMSLDAAELYKRGSKFDDLANANNAQYNHTAERRASPEDNVFNRLLEWDFKDRFEFATMAIEGFGVEGIKSTLKQTWDSVSHFQKPDYTNIKEYLNEVRAAVDGNNFHPLWMQERVQGIKMKPGSQEDKMTADLDQAVSRVSKVVYAP